MIFKEIRGVCPQADNPEAIIHLNVSHRYLNATHRHILPMSKPPASHALIFILRPSCKIWRLFCIFLLSSTDSLFKTDPQNGASFISIIRCLKSVVILHPLINHNNVKDHLLNSFRKMIVKMTFTSSLKPNLRWQY